MIPPELVVYFIDGLDHEFVTRCLRHSEKFAELFAAEYIHCIDGTVHSLQCMGQVFCGRHIEVLHYEGYEQLPRCERIINWDMLLSHCHADELIWSRLNALGYKVGLMEMLGVFLPPELEGFSISKHLVPLGIQELYDRQLCHHPPGIGALYQELKHAHEYPQNINTVVTDPHEIVDVPPEDLSESDLWWVMEACGYRDLIPFADMNIRRSFRVTRDLLETHPAEVIFIHTGHFDRLLHAFRGWGAEERELMFLLDRVMANLEATLQPRNTLVFSDHGMALGPAHWSGTFLNRANHDEGAALVAASGERVEAALASVSPTDLCAVHDVVLRTMDPGAEAHISAPLSAEQTARQMEQIIVQRDRLLMELCKKGG